MDEKEVLARLARLEEPAVLATIVSAKGSTPRKTGARMLIGRGGVIAGTVGGGCGEGEVIEAAQELFAGGPPTTVRVDLTDDFTSWSPAVCGGIMNVFIERANPELFDRAARLPPAGAEVEIHYRRPGRATEVYRQAVLESGPQAVVTFQPHAPIDSPIMVAGSAILEPGAPVIWFTFPGAWHDIGLFHLADGTFTGLYANILTPVEFLNRRTWATTDLCLDLWAPRSGPPRLLDEADLAEAVAAGLVEKDVAARARQEAAALLEGIAAGSWPPEPVREWSLARAREAYG